MDELDIFEEDWSDQVKKGASGLAVKKLENLTANMPSQEELDKFIGKKGQDLLDDGWTMSGWSIFDETMFFMDKGDYSYNVYFEEKLEEKDDYDYEQDLPKLTVSKIEFSYISSSATDIQE